jgi:hypothetical protein
MTRARWGALAALLIVLVGVTALALSARQGSHASPKPRLALLSGLPIVLGEDFGLKDNGSPALTALSAQFEVVPISTTSAKDLSKERLLLLAQPPAQAPENLVVLDGWVRAGGRVLLLADPLLEWPSKRPLGDPLRPPPMFTDTGLLGHWGLRLDAPDQRGPVTRSLAGKRVVTVSPGALYGNCGISADRLVADCRIGKGRAVVVADADLLNVGNLGAEAHNNLSAVTQELAQVASR